MRTLTLILISALSLASSSAFAASYQQIDGTIVDPIQCWSGCVGDHPYSGNNLEPLADLVGAALSGSYLLDANLTGANLSGAALNSAVVFGANLSDANLTGTDLSGSDLFQANLTGANLSGADLTSTTGPALYDINTDFTSTGFDPVAAGWTLVPEPGTALLMGLGLAGLASRRR